MSAEYSQGVEVHPQRQHAGTDKVGVAQCPGRRAQVHGGIPRQQHRPSLLQGWQKLPAAWQACSQAPAEHSLLLPHEVRYLRGGHWAVEGEKMPYPWRAFQLLHQHDHAHREVQKGEHREAAHPPRQSQLLGRHGEAEERHEARPVEIALARQGATRTGNHWVRGVRPVAVCSTCAVKQRVGPGGAVPGLVHHAQGGRATGGHLQEHPLRQHRHGAQGEEYK
mmetsp:Transcript_34241/g.102299  ORF Transcript_34241/g.102299 Transcript_34241/m.102299 type:complete len:222 (-) Transcript_34241:148-813(-)